MAKKIIILSMLVVIMTFMGSNVAFADETQFYNDVIEKYKDARDPSPEQVKYLKDYMKNIGLDTYEYGSNTVDCSWYDVTCHVNGSFLFTNMVGLVKAGVQQLEDIVIEPKDITTKDFDVWLYMYNFKQLGWTMAAIFLMYHVVKTIALYMGESDEGMNVLQEKIWKIITVGILLGIYTQFFEWMMKFEQYAVTDIMNTNPNWREIAISLAVNSPAYGIILSLFLAVIIIVFAFAYLYRFALFTLLFVTGVIAIPTMLNDQFNFFSVWLRTMISNIITFTLQTLCFALGFSQLVSLEFGSMFYGIAFFILALTIPAILGQLGASTGSGRAVASGAKRLVIRR